MSMAFGPVTHLDVSHCYFMNVITTCWQADKLGPLYFLLNSGSDDSHWKPCNGSSLVETLYSDRKLSENKMF